MLVVLITSDFLNLRTFAGGFLVHHWIRLHLGYLLHLCFSPGKRIWKENIQKLLFKTGWYSLYCFFLTWDRLQGDFWYIIGFIFIWTIDYTSPSHPQNVLRFRTSKLMSTTTRKRLLFFYWLFLIDSFAGREEEVYSIACMKTNLMMYQKSPGKCS